MATLARFVLCAALTHSVVNSLETLKVIDTHDFFHQNVNIQSAIELLIPTSAAIENEKCRNHSILYVEELRKFKLWATEMFDATSKFPTGILMGSTYDFGNYDECVRVQVNLPDDKFFGKYCMAKITIDPPKRFINNENTIPAWESDYYYNSNISTWEKILALSKDRSKQLRNEVHWSFCIPSSCTEKDLQMHLQQIATSYNNLQDFKISVDVDKRLCNVQEPFNFTPGRIVMLCIFLLFGLLVFCATIYHFITSLENMEHFQLKGRAEIAVMAFSAAANVKKIFGHKSNEDGLDCIHGMKVLSMLLIIMGHRMLFVLGSPLTDSNFIEGFYGKIEAAVILNGPIIVDTFFNISGFLATYLLLTEYTKRGRTVNVFLLYLHRIIRLTPTYAIVLAFYCTLFHQLDSGPLWEERIGVEQERCLSSWWTNLLFINNYVNTDKICMFQSWFITCDMHFFILTPILVTILWKRPKLGLSVLSILITLSIVSTFLVSYFKKLDAILLLYMRFLKDPITDKTFQNVYIPSHTRASAYFVGMIGGYIKYKMKMDQTKFPKMILYAGWILSVILIETTIYSAYIFYLPASANYDVHFTALYSAFHHFTWSACISWFILALSGGNGGWPAELLAWRPFAALSRITYSAFLVHGGIQLYAAARMRVPFTPSFYSLTIGTFGDIMGAYVIGFFLCLFFESPIYTLEKLLLPTTGRKEHPKKLERSNGDVYIPKITMISNNVAA